MMLSPVVETAASRSLPAADRAALHAPRVWAIGGGKGGVGKSVVTANLAMAFAERGQRCALVDADFGAANLHTVLGVRAPDRGLADFLEREVPRLADVLTPTPIPNLSIVSGAKCALDAANLAHGQKLRLIRNLRSLPVDHVFVDLSAGSSFNSLDLFLEADRGLLVVVPEPTSIENAYHFLKAAFFRTLRRAVRRSHSRRAIHAALEAQARRRIRSARELVARLSALDPEVGCALEESVRSFQPLLLVNQARTPEHSALAWRIADAANSYLGSRVVPVGTLPRDESVVDALSRGLAVSRLHAGCPFVLDIEQIAGRLLDEDPASAGPAQDEGGPAHRLSSALYDLRYFASHGEVTPQAPVHPLPNERPARSVPPGPAPGPSRPGAHLRHCRETLGLSIPDLCHRTRIRQLEHIEAERFDGLPPEVYVRGFVRQYAQALGIAESDALTRCFIERYRASRGEPDDALAPAPPW